MSAQANTINLSVTDPEVIRAAMRAVPVSPVVYDGDYEIARLSYDQLRSVDGHMRVDVCFECSQAFVSVHTSIVVVRNDVRRFHDYHDGDQGVPWNELILLNPDCWESRQDNWGQPRTPPPGPITWEVSESRPGYPTTGYIPTDDEGFVTITVNGTPVGIDLRAGMVFVQPDDGEEREVVAQFEPVPAEPGPDAS